MRRFSQRPGLTTLSEINVTPLLDLCFVLLVIFMITTPLLESNTELELPSGAPSEHPVDAGKVQTLSIDRNAAVRLNDDPVTMEQLPARLEALKREKPDLAVLIRPHKDLPVQKLMALMDCLQRAQITKVGVATQERAGGAAPP
jgi:biopolymer transport protein ExbD